VDILQIPDMAAALKEIAARRGIGRPRQHRHELTLAAGRGAFAARLLRRTYLLRCLPNDVCRRPRSWRAARGGTRR
jgi:hypothetical protein